MQKMELGAKELETKKERKRRETKGRQDAKLFEDTLESQDCRLRLGLESLTAIRAFAP
jgi:hypothetical protein